MIDIVVITLIGIMWFLLGFFLGNLNGKKKDVKEFVDETGQKIFIETKKLLEPSAPTGRIKPKSAEDIRKLDLSPQRREALEETKRTLDTIPDLVAAKELAAQMKKGEYGD